MSDVRWRELLRRPPWRTVVPAVSFLALIVSAYGIWSPGSVVRDGRHDLQTNGIWIQHGWLGDDGWFRRNDRDPSRFRSTGKIRELRSKLEAHHVRYIYPHLCPADSSGRIPPVDPVQSRRFLAQFAEFKVLPWVGGVLGSDCFPDDPAWRLRFITSIRDLLREYPSFAGVHVNIEPLPGDNHDYLVLLRELRTSIPKGKILSVAAYPPPTRWHPFPEVHWNEDFFRKVAAESDQVVVMMYDTSIRIPKLYEHVMRGWTTQVLSWGEPTQVLLGVPDYDDAGVGYHHPEVENLVHSLRGIHAGLQDHPSLPANYAGISIYCEWQTDEAEWRTLTREFNSGR